jgi:hypothetical protein
MKKNDSTKPVGPLKMLGMWLLLAAVSIGSFMLSSSLMSGGRPAPPQQNETDISCFAFMILIFSGFFTIAGVAAYLIVIATNCFTFNFEKQVWHSSFRARLYIVNIIVGTALLLGLGGLGAALGGVFVAGTLHLSRQLSFMIPFLLIFIPGQLFFSWFVLWNPLISSLTRKRLTAKGLSTDEIQEGIHAGLSDPEVSSMKKFSMIEDDIGMLWLTPEYIRYEGDSQAFRISRAELTRIERAVDKGSIAAYAGAVHIILHWTDSEGTSHKRRLHVENCWTLSRQAKKLDELDTRLNEWKTGAEK